jgi:exopolysaccharide biosynthesis polyprenyl glycosylphosphotransferase
MVTSRRSILMSLFKAFDLTLLAGAFIVAAVPNLKDVGAVSLSNFLSTRISVRSFVLFSGLLLLWHLLFSFFGLYESKRLLRGGTETSDVLKATSFATIGLFVVGSLFHLSVIHPLYLTVFWLVSSTIAVLSRRVLRLVLAEIRLRGRNLRHVLIVGTNPRAVKLASDLQADSALGYCILGFADREWPGMGEFRKSAWPLVCDFTGLPSFLRHSVVDEVMIALPMHTFYGEASRVVALCEELGITTHCLSRLFDLKAARTGVEVLDHESLITVQAGAMQGGAFLVKRVLDIAISLLCIILFAPVFLVVTLLIKFTSPGPIFFVQERVGLSKRLISVHKFRTMVQDAEQKQHQLERFNEASGPVFKIKNDPRITPIGRFLRKTSIDELPQLFDVLKGDMSLVGPRPLPMRDYRGFDKDWQRRRFSIRPGITCLWQIMGRSSVSFERWMELDMEYIDRWSVWLDLQILIRTIPAVLKGSGAV